MPNPYHQTKHMKKAVCQPATSFTNHQNINHTSSPYNVHSTPIIVITMVQCFECPSNKNLRDNFHINNHIANAPPLMFPNELLINDTGVI